MKSKVAAGVAGVGTYDYENMNFGLCRLLISTVSGAVAKSTSYTPSYLNDQLWDLNTINAYKLYMQAKVFTPSGVANAGFVPARLHTRRAGLSISRMARPKAGTPAI